MNSLHDCKLSKKFQKFELFLILTRCHTFERHKFAGLLIYLREYAMLHKDASFSWATGVSFQTKLTTRRVKGFHCRTPPWAWIPLLLCSLFAQTAFPKTRSLSNITNLFCCSRVISKGTRKRSCLCFECTVQGAVLTHAASPHNIVIIIIHNFAVTHTGITRTKRCLAKAITLVSMLR